MCFDAPAKGPSFVVESIINSYFICDVTLNFFVSHRKVVGDVETSHSKIIRKYLRGWFIIDFVASIPIEWITILIENSQNFEFSVYNYLNKGKVWRLLRTLRFIKLARVFRVGKLRAFADRFEQELVGSSWRVLAFAITKIILSRRAAGGAAERSCVR